MTGNPLEYESYRCPICGAPVAVPSAVGDVIRCDYCLGALRAEPRGYRTTETEDAPMRDPHLPRLWIGGARYAIRGRIARGESSDVFLAHRDARPTELVVLKALRAHADQDLFDREAQVIDALHTSRVEGADHFRRLLPQPVARGIARLGATGREGEHPVTLYRFQSGFVHTFEDVARAYPQGVAPEAAVWLFKRVLELLDFIHRAGFVHGAVHPAHLLVHARDHGVILTGYSCAGSRAAPEALRAVSAAHDAFYPSAEANGAPVTFETDIAMSARAILHVLGGDPRTPAAPPQLAQPLADLLEARARQIGTAQGAWATRDALDAVARAVFGPPRYVPFSMPGWNKVGQGAP